MSIAVHYPTTPTPPPPLPPSEASNSSKWGPYSSAGEFSASMVVILAGLFCAFLIAGSLGAAVHYLLCGHRRGRRQPASREDDDPEKQTEEVATTVSAFVVLVFSAAGGVGGRGMKQQQQLLQLAGGGAECAICLTEFVDGDAVGVLPACNHGFHVRCVERWLAGRSSCPTCRAHCDVVGGSGPEEKELRG